MTTTRSAVACFPPALDSNPYQRLLYEHLAPLGVELAPPARLRARWLWEVRRSVRALHFHWPQSYYRASWRGRGEALLTLARLPLFGLRLAVARALGYRVIWTVHQVYPHESRSRLGDRLAAALLARSAQVLIAHERATASDIARRLGDEAARRVAIVPHGSYVGVYPAGRGRREAREALGLDEDAVVFLAFGLLRRYKDVGLLLDAFSRFRARSAVLVVAGMPLDEEVAQTVRAAAEADPRIRPVLEFVPDERVAELYALADAAIVARSDGGTSGALVLALSLGVPVVAADTEAYRELVGEPPAGWLFEPGSAESLGAALQRVAADPARAALADTAAGRAEALAWPPIAARTAQLLMGHESSSEVVGNGSGTRPLDSPNG